MYYFDVKEDTHGEKYVVISESTRKGGDKKMRNRVMVWKEDFEQLFDCLWALEEFLEQEGEDTGGHALDEEEMVEEELVERS